MAAQIHLRRGAEVQRPRACRATSRRSSSTSCCATAPPRPWSTAPSTRNRSKRSSPSRERRNTRMIAGKMMMDRNAPAALTDTRRARLSRESRRCSQAWHGRGRQLYAISPRFALTSSEAQLEAAGALLREHPDAYLQTHLAENHEEIATVRRLFPSASSYTDVYDRCGLLGPRSIFGHCLHLDGRGAAAPVGHALDRRVLPDLEPVHRQRPVRSGAAARPGAPGAGQPRHRRRRRHQLLDAAHRRRGLQGAAAAAARTCRRSTPST